MVLLPFEAFTAMPPATVANFVDGVLQSQLLEAEQCEEVVRLQARCSDMRELAQELMKRDWLTAYQVNQISQGRGAALTMAGRGQSSGSVSADRSN